LYVVVVGTAHLNEAFGASVVSPPAPSFVSPSERPPIADNDPKEQLLGRRDLRHKPSFALCNERVWACKFFPDFVPLCIWPENARNHQPMVGISFQQAGRDCVRSKQSCDRNPFDDGRYLPEIAHVIFHIVDWEPQIGPQKRHHHIKHKNIGTFRQLEMAIGSCGGFLRSISSRMGVAHAPSQPYQLNNQRNQSQSTDYNKSPSPSSKA